MTGPYAPLYFGLLLCNVAAPQLLWFRRMRTSIPVIFTVSFIVSIGMWLERFVIVVMSLHRDFLPSSWDMSTPTFWDWSLYIGIIGLFCGLLFLVVRFLPMISIFEMQELVTQEEKHGRHDKAAGESVI